MVEKISPTDTNVTTLLNKAREEPLILHTEEAGDFALIPLDDEVIDLLLELNPTFIGECRQIRERMKQGEYLTHGQVLEALQYE